MANDDPKVPHLRMMVTLASIILLLVLGDASIDNKVGTPFVGLHIGRPWMVEAFLLVFLAVQMWQFWVFSDSKWDFMLGVRSEAKQLLDKNDDLRARLEMLLEHQQPVDDKKIPFDLVQTPLFSKWEIAITKVDPSNGDCTTADGAHLPNFAFLGWKSKSLAKWAWRSRAFPTRQLPFGLAVIAMLSGAWRLLALLLC